MNEMWSLKEADSILGLALFSNLGPYNHSLDIHVFTIRKHHVQLAGKVALPLPTIQRNKPIEGWFEMQPPEHAMKKGHVDSLGELNLRVLVKEDVALPYKAYTSLGSVRPMERSLLLRHT